jgi:transposase-like protein
MRIRHHDDAFKRSVVEASNSGMKNTEISKRFKVHQSLITRWRKELGSNPRTPQSHIQSEKPSDINQTFNQTFDTLEEDITRLRTENRLLKRLLVDVAQGNV